MNIRDLLDVRVICEAGSLRKAAEVLGVTQPTLSNRIARLEDQLGSPLFDRRGGRARPTDLALFISSRAGKLSDLAQRLAREARRLGSGASGVVRIGMGQVVLRILAADESTALDGLYMDVSLEVHAGHTAQLTDSLLRGDLDVVVSSQADPDHESIDSELLLDTAIVVVAHPDHPLCAEPPPDIRGLFTYPISISLLERHYREMLRSYGIDIENVEGRLVCADFEFQLRAVTRRPRMFTAGPHMLFAREIEAGRLAIVRVEVPFRHRIYLHTLQDAYPLPAVTRVRETIRNFFGNLRAADTDGGATASLPR